MIRRRSVLILTILTLMCWSRVTTAQPVCFQALPFTDVFIFTAELASVSPLQWRLTAMMEATGLYQLGGAGLLCIDVIEPGSGYAVRVSLANPGFFFAENAACAMTATVDPDTLTGPWRITCTGGLGARFTVNGTLALIDCSSVAVAEVSDAPVQPRLDAIHVQGLTAAGEAVNNEVVAGP